MSRVAERQGFEPPVKLRLLETDADVLEAQIVEVRKEAERFQKFVRDELASQRKILVGLLIAITTASVLLAINVLVIGGRA